MPDGSYVGPDPREYFPGDPYTTNGWGCYAPCLISAIKKISGFECFPMKGLVLEEVKTFIDAGEPVIFWGTINFAPPRKSLCWKTEEGREVQWVSPMHCTLLIGYDDEGYYFNDPTGGKDAYYPAAAVEAGYAAQGSEIMVVRKCSQ